MRPALRRGEENPTPVPPRAPATARPGAASLVPARTEGGHLMIEAHGLTKRYGDKLAVDDLTFTVRPGVVTGFLGPNGAGKSTTMRMILGLDAPTRGTVTVNGRPYREHAAPLREVGALLDARSVHPARSARNHLLALAQTSGIPRSRGGGFPGGGGPRPGHPSPPARGPAPGDPGGAGQRPGHRGDPLDPVPASK